MDDLRQGRKRTPMAFIRFNDPGMNCRRHNELHTLCRRAPLSPAISRATRSSAQCKAARASC